MKKQLKQSFLSGLVFSGTVLFSYLWFTAFTALPTQENWDTLNSTIWNNLVTSINDIWAKTDEIYNNWWNIGIWTSTASSKLEVNWDIVWKAQVFRAYMSSSFAHPGWIWSKLPFNSIRFNTIQWTFDAVNKRFTPNRAWYYQISITWYSTTWSAWNDRYAIWIVKWWNLEWFVWANYSSVDTPLSWPTITVYCNWTTDSIEINMFSAITANITWWNSWWHVTYWHMNYLWN